MVIVAACIVSLYKQFHLSEWKKCGERSITDVLVSMFIKDGASRQSNGWFSPWCMSPCVSIPMCVCVLVLLRKERVVRDNERWKESGAARGGANRPLRQSDSPIKGRLLH